MKVSVSLIMKDRLLKKIILTGFKDGVRTAWWLTKIMVAITFAVTLFKWSGYLENLSVLLEPVLKHVGLNVEGILVYLTGVLANIYSAIAVMTTFNVSIRMGTILAVMNLICHNLIIETIIQKKIGSNAIKIAVLRIGASIFSAWILNIILPMEMSGTILLHTDANPDTGLWSFILDWFFQMVKIIPIMYLLIISLNILQTFLREYGLIKYITRPMAPIIRLFGLNSDCAFLWVVLNTLGLAYGSAVILSTTNSIPKNHLRLLNTHAAITHSLLEDTLAYAALGLSAIWLIIPRVVLSIIAVWTERLIIIWHKSFNKTPKI